MTLVVALCRVQRSGAIQQQSLVQTRSLSGTQMALEPGFNRSGGWFLSKKHGRR